MRYAKDHKADTRTRVVETAGRVLRRDGVDGTGLIGLMREAGLTKGGFYAHFESKDALVAEAVETALAGSAGRLRDVSEGAAVHGRSRLGAVVDNYLSAEHVRARDQGCTISALLSDLTRGSDDVREAAARGAAGLAAVIEDALPPSFGQDRAARARVILGMLTGCLQLARLERDATRRDAMLAAGKRAAHVLAQDDATT
jgi:TetR/AcrR family transcriptional repressor of nem operon